MMHSLCKKEKLAEHQKVQASDCAIRARMVPAGSVVYVGMYILLIIYVRVSFGLGATSTRPSGSYLSSDGHLPALRFPRVLNATGWSTEALEKRDKPSRQTHL
jgi:hypothetical protein